MGMRGIREGRCIGELGETVERGTGANAECGEREGKGRGRGGREGGSTRVQ